MSRPLRIEYQSALYHVTSRGDRREPIYEDDEDREKFLTILGQVIDTYNWICHGYCLMTNHYHLVIETPDGNLSKGMRQLNGVYTQASNRRHDRVGHLFQGRYKGILVDANTYLLELTRYVVLNPVRADMVKKPDQWPWSSYSAMIGETQSPSWLATDDLLAQFSKRRKVAVRRYKQFVAEGIGVASIWQGINRQVFLGNDAFVEQAQAMDESLPGKIGVPKAQSRPPAPTLEELGSTFNKRNDAIVAAHATGEYSYQQIADYYGLHFSTVGIIVRQARKK